MTKFIIKKLPYDLTSNAGLALVGQYFKLLDFGGLDRQFPMMGQGISNSDVVKSYLGLLVQGKSDFDAIEAFRGDDFFRRSLKLSSVPSSPTLRQRMNTHAASWFELADAFNLALLSAKHGGQAVDFGALPRGYMPVDWDTFVMDNSGTRKEDVGRTYQGVDGYTPSATYIGTPGYCLELALRPGVQHSALESDLNLQRVLPMAAKLTVLPLLFRADSGLCSRAIMQEITVQGQALQREMAFIIKWNPRSTPVEAWAQQRVADASTRWTWLREGKRECYWQELLTLQGVGTQANPARRIYRLSERSIDKHGQPLLLSQYELEGWTTTLPERFDVAAMIALYCDARAVLRHQHIHACGHQRGNQEVVAVQRVRQHHVAWVEVAQQAAHQTQLAAAFALIGSDCRIQRRNCASVMFSNCGLVSTLKNSTAWVDLACLSMLRRR